MTTESTTPETTPKPTADEPQISWHRLRDAGLNVDHAYFAGDHFAVYNAAPTRATTMVTITVDIEHDGWILKFSSRGITHRGLSGLWSQDDEIHYATCDLDAMLAKALWWLK